MFPGYILLRESLIGSKLSEYFDFSFFMLIYIKNYQVYEKSNRNLVSGILCFSLTDYRLPITCKIFRKLIFVQYTILFMYSSFYSPNSRLLLAIRVNK